MEEFAGLSGAQFAGSLGGGPPHRGRGPVSHNEICFESQTPSSALALF